MKQTGYKWVLVMAGIGCLASLVGPGWAYNRVFLQETKAETQFVAGETSTPGGKQIGYVDLLVDTRKRRVVEILTTAGGLSLKQRAQTIASRMRIVNAADSRWWKRLSTGEVRGLWVVRTPKAPHGFLLTADPRFAHEWGVSSPKLASLLMHTIENTFDPPQVAMRGLSDLRLQAVEMRIEGDNAYQRRDLSNAEQSYKKAIEIAPSYVVPYFRLAHLYAEQSESDKLHEILMQVQRHSLDSEQQQELQRLLKAHPSSH